MKAALNTAEAPMTILRLAVAIYPTGAWARSPPPLILPGEFEESWQLRSGLSSWAWRATGELKDNGALRGISSPKNSLFTILFIYNNASHSAGRIWTRYPSAARCTHPRICPPLSDAAAACLR